MPESKFVWGIDVGQCGLKAIRLKYLEESQQVVSVAFDYVPHPKILSQPDANPDELIAQALDTFLSRNSVKGDVIAISVPGQTALARFIQLPPVEASKVVEIVKYEARQQIPFALDEVIWDYQPLSGGAETSGFLLDAEVGLFAMKREQVQQYLNPYLTKRIEVELVQIAPLALYNFVCHDQLGATSENLDAVEDDEYTILLDMGTDNTTLLVTNGKKIWNRNVPMGGNHFTRALTKEMKLTFAKAEHLKCNATKAPDPKAVFQALRPVFNDYAAEVQRSIGYFSSVNRNAKIKRIIGLGNGFKLAGLQKFLQQNLQIQVDRLDHYAGLVGDAVLNAPLFQENIQSFAVSYGLGLQGLKLTRIHTSLLPPEIKTARLIRAKKPWAVAAASILLCGVTLSTVGYANGWKKVREDRWKEGQALVQNVVTKKGQFKSKYDEAVSKNTEQKAQGDSLLGMTTGNTHWMEVFKAINECMPRDVGDQLDEDDPTRQNRIRIKSIRATKSVSPGNWFKNLDPNNGRKYLRKDDVEALPAGGYLFTLSCVHYHDDPRPMKVEETAQFWAVRNFVENLQKWEFKQRGSSEPVPVRKLGITHATLTSFQVTEIPYYGKLKTPPASSGINGTPPLPGSPPPVPGQTVLPPGFQGVPVPESANEERARLQGGGRFRGAGPGTAAAAPATAALASGMIKQTDFVVEFFWNETPEADRKPTDPNEVPVTDPAAAPAPGTNPPVPGAPLPAKK